MVLGGNVHYIVPPQVRKLNFEVKKIRKVCIMCLDKLFKEHGVYEKIQSLSKKAKYLVMEELKNTLYIEPKCIKVD